MQKRSHRMTLAAMVMLLLTTCTKRDEGSGAQVTSTLDLSGSTLMSNHDRASTLVYFSADGGVTLTNASDLLAGHTYRAMVKADGCSDCRFVPPGEYLTKANFFALDWSASNPKPDDPTADDPEFIVASSNTVAVKVTDIYCPYNPSFFTGSWNGDEIGTCCIGSDTNNFVNFAVRPDSLIMDNWWGVGMTAYMLLHPSTSVFDQTLTLPTQTTGEGGIASGTGTYDQCRGTFVIDAFYTIRGRTYHWQYHFHK